VGFVLEVQDAVLADEPHDPRVHNLGILRVGESQPREGRPGGRSIRELVSIDACDASDPAIAREPAPMVRYPLSGAR
jgi:hypothetical protein